MYHSLFPLSREKENTTGAPKCKSKTSVYGSVLSLLTALASPDRRGTSRREGERDVQTVRAGMQFRIRNRCSGSEGSLPEKSVQ